MGSLTLTIMNYELILELRVESGFAYAHNYELRIINCNIMLILLKKELRIERKC